MPNGCSSKPNAVLLDRRGRYQWEMYSEFLRVRDLRKHRFADIPYAAVRKVSSSLGKGSVELDVKCSGRPFWLAWHLGEGLEPPRDADEYVAQVQQALDLYAESKRRGAAEAALAEKRALETTDQTYTMVVVSSKGMGLPEAAVVILTFGQDSVSFTMRDSDFVTSLPFEEIELFEVSGPGKISQDAGLIGGGFGIKGALLGMAVATAVNALTNKTETHTFLTMATPSKSVTLLTVEYEPEKLKMRLASYLAHVQGNKRSATPQVGQDLVSHLSRLSEMRAAGLLSEEEFQKAKGKLLSD